MRKLGLIGGMSWYSTRTYYEHINRGVQASAGKQASAPLLIESLDFSDLVRLSSAEDWTRASEVLAAIILEKRHRRERMQPKVQEILLDFQDRVPTPPTR